MPVCPFCVLARGFRVGVIERGPLLGREQEWNISEAELEEMVEANVLSKEVRNFYVQSTIDRLA